MCRLFCFLSQNTHKNMTVNTTNCLTAIQVVTGKLWQLQQHLTILDQLLNFRRWVHKSDEGGFTNLSNPFMCTPIKSPNGMGGSAIKNAPGFPQSLTNIPSELILEIGRLQPDSPLSNALMLHGLPDSEQYLVWCNV